MIGVDEGPVMSSIWCRDALGLWKEKSASVSLPIKYLEFDVRHRSSRGIDC